jgi:hypothetical protein
MSDKPAKQWWKVLVNGQSCHGGTLAWSLPTAEAPGDWHEVTGELSICSRGIHVTDNPAAWWKQGAAVYLCEVDGIEAEDSLEFKAVVRKARLIREATPDELIAACIYSSGVHTVTAGRAVTSGSATVVAYGSATVEAYDSATVEAYDSATVRAYDSATVRAYGSATVRAYGSATVNNYGSGAASVAHNAVLIDRTKAHPVVTVGGEK